VVWLVSGGAGYIGSHVCQTLLENGEKVIALDNLVNSNGSRLSGICELIESDFRNFDQLDSILKRRKVKGIMHLAGLKSPSESLEKPDLYNEVNNVGTKNFIEHAVSSSVEIFINSSSAAVYGESKVDVFTENSETVPINPYGKSKLASENFLRRNIEERKILGTSLRYFNVVGSFYSQFCDTSEINLFPKIKKAINLKEPVYIFGNDYKTRDGTCIRDYVHVADVARAHVLAAIALLKKELPPVLNVGTGVGYSVLEIIREFESASGTNLTKVNKPRRVGDAAIAVADPRLAKELIAFQPIYGLKEMVLSSYFN
jgi:UDP-glucose 4-epimerase